jgi:hypothetical protein
MSDHNQAHECRALRREVRRFVAGGASRSAAANERYRAAHCREELTRWRAARHRVAAAEERTR